MKDFLYKRYWIDGLSLKDIGIEIGITPSAVGKKMQKFGIKRRVNDRNKFDHLRKIRLTEKQLFVVYGCVLGDGYLACPYNKGVSLRLKHCKKQLPYLLYKRDLLATLFPTKESLITQERFGKTLVSYELVGITHPDLNGIYKNFYCARKKFIPYNICDFINEIALAILFMDDGSYCESGNVRTLNISTECFPKNEVELLRDCIYNKFNVRFNVHRHEGKYILQVGNKENIQRFLSIVYPIVGHLFHCKGKTLRDYTPSPSKITG